MTVSEHWLDYSLILEKSFLLLLRVLNITAQVTILGVIVGIIVSLLSITFVYGVREISDYREAYQSCVFQVYNFCFSVAPLVFLFFTGLIIILVKKTSHISRYHGPADVILSAHSEREDLETKTGFLSTFAAFISASGGASVGQYGPLVHLGGTIGNIINKFTPGLLTKDTFIGCGVAAAISAGFNSPIGGIIFAHEAILRHFSFKAIAPIAVSSVVSSTLTAYFFPSGILFQNTNSEIALLPSVSLSLILGPFCAFGAVIFMKSLLFLQAKATSISESELLRIFIAVIACGILGGFFPEILGLGGKTILGVLENSFSLSFLFTILILKLFVTVICLSLGFFGGVFSPALVLGALIGGIFSFFGNYFGFNLLGDSLILAGMAALSASVIGAPIASIVIIFELTHSYDLAFVAIICVAASCLVSTLTFGHSFFDKQLINRNFKITSGRSEILLSEIPISSLLGKNEYLKVDQFISKRDLLDQFKEADFTEAYLVDKDNGLIGKVKVNSILNNEDTVKVFEPLKILDSSTVSEAIQKASNFVGESIPVVNNKNTLLGVISEADLFSSYLSVQSTISKIEKD